MSTDVVVLGTGNAAMCAALSAREHGARVHVLEKAGRDEAGGDTWYTAGAFRVTHHGADDLAALLDERDERRLANTLIDAYSSADYFADLQRLTDGRSTPDLARTVAAESRAAVEWLQRRGVRWRLQYERQSHQLAQGWRFFGNLPLGVVGGGKGLVTQQHAAAVACGITIEYQAAGCELLRRGDGPVIEVRTAAGVTYRADAVILACGGFQADRELRRRHLGEQWANAKVRGTRHNTGDGIEMAVTVGAATTGDWSGCHAVAWDSAAPLYGDRDLTNRYTRHSYPYGIVVNRAGLRFVDEGADYRNYTYARFGREIARQPGGIAYQIFDDRSAQLLNQDEYHMAGVSHVSAGSIGELARRAGIDPDGLGATVATFNAATDGAPFDPTVKDGKAAPGVQPPKSNWASPLVVPPFHAYLVTTGVTFTYGGLHIDNHGRVLDGSGVPIPGLYAAGEIVGGLFHGNYPGGSGLSAGAVFGRRAGCAAARGSDEISTSREWSQ